MATEIGRFGKTGQGFLFEGDAHLVDQQKYPAHSTGQKGAVFGDTYLSSEPGAYPGKLYKFKNIHGDRGTFDGLSSDAQNQPPSSVWRDHPTIPEHLAEIPGR